MTEPRQKPGSSKQDFGTPDDFFQAVCRRFGTPVIDLAARADNTLCEQFIGPEQNTLIYPWPVGVLRWLNNEFGSTEKYVEKCRRVALDDPRGTTLQLIPASIGTNWFAEHCEGVAEVIAIRPRLVFKGTEPNPKTGRPDPYPKDLMLLVWGFLANPGRLSTWRWIGPLETIDP